MSGCSSKVTQPSHSQRARRSSKPPSAPARDVFEVFLSALPIDKPAVTAVAAIAHAPGFLVRLPPLDLAAAAERLARAVNQKLAARQLDGRATPVFSARLSAVKVERVHEPTKVTAIVATRDAPEKLSAFLSSFNAALGVQRADVIVVDAGSTMSEAIEALEALPNEGVRVAHVPGPYSAERAFNVGASIATSDYVVFATTDMTALRSGWLEEMLGVWSKSTSPRSRRRCCGRRAWCNKAVSSSAQVFLFRARLRTLATATSATARRWRSREKQARRARWASSFDGACSTTLAALTSRVSRCAFPPSTSVCGCAQPQDASSLPRTPSGGSTG